MILADAVKYLSIPQYETLSVKEIRKFIAANTQCLVYLPEEQEWDKLPKQWMSNVIHTTVGDSFSHWVKERIEARNAGVVKEKKHTINMDPHIMQAFLNSSAVSSMCILLLHSSITHLNLFFSIFSPKGKWCQHA